jgi:hypothetical protein
MATEHDIRREFEAHRASIRAIFDGAFDDGFRQIEENKRQLEEIHDDLRELHRPARPSRSPLRLVRGEGEDS